MLKLQSRQEYILRVNEERYHQGFPVEQLEPGAGSVGGHAPDTDLSTHLVGGIVFNLVNSQQRSV